ncbi:hypothetical protein FGW20_06295 [Methanoculleus sp. FWC-SCC3]|uniref:Polymerase nucleotidyl transferase domain-containing protein n=1 Tax=Methanoculleus methanifontis TaxID=2584086 RepID=A0ABT8M0U8_9EURY|nr:hypothetical protein [Methanoculleus sp. FWC-SCC3]MDN7012654.1 hypothetical protein [Methanoculleus sp. FWC-SCC3]
MIPDFDNFGNIPPGIYCPDLAEFKDRFVVDFPSSVTRPSLYTDFVNFSMMVASFKVADIQWVAGSYTSSKVDPDDVDLVIHFNAEEFKSRDETMNFAMTTDPDQVKNIYNCHLFLIPMYPLASPKHAQGINMSAYWRKWFEKDRADRPRGLIEFNLSSDTHVEVLAEEGNLQ